MRIPFEFAGDRGLVTVEVAPNTEPLSVGKSERERGMPVCTASVEFGARGYRGLVGWVQLVREPDAAGPYRIDPFDLFEDSTAPFAWYGLQPTLFDAPSRWREGAVDWEANSHRRYMSSAFPRWGFDRGGHFTTQRDGGPQAR